MVFRTFIIYGYYAYVNLFYARNFKGNEQRILQSRIPRLRRVAFATYFISAAVPSLRWVAKCQWHLLSNDRNEVKKDPAIIVFYLIGLGCQKTR